MQQVKRYREQYYRLGLDRYRGSDKDIPWLIGCERCSSCHTFIPVQVYTSLGCVFQLYEVFCLSGQDLSTIRQTVYCSNRLLQDWKIWKVSRSPFIRSSGPCSSSSGRCSFSSLLTFPWFLLPEAFAFNYIDKCQFLNDCKNSSGVKFGDFGGYLTKLLSVQFGEKCWFKKSGAAQCGGPPSCSKRYIMFSDSIGINV